MGFTNASESLKSKQKQSWSEAVWSGSALLDEAFFADCLKNLKLEHLLLQ